MKTLNHRRWCDIALRIEALTHPIERRSYRASTCKVRDLFCLAQKWTRWLKSSLLAAIARPRLAAPAFDRVGEPLSSCQCLQQTLISEYFSFYFILYLVVFGILFLHFRSAEAALYHILGGTFKFSAPTQLRYVKSLMVSGLYTFPLRGRTRPSFI